MKLPVQVYKHEETNEWTIREAPVNNISRLILLIELALSYAI
jgi:hypothetical protein